MTRCSDGGGPGESADPARIARLDDAKRAVDVPHCRHRVAVPHASRATALERPAYNNTPVNRSSYLLCDPHFDGSLGDTRHFRRNDFPQWLGRSLPTTAIRARSPAGSFPDPRMWESHWTMPIAGRLSRGSPVSPSLAFRCCTPRVSFPGMTGTYGSQLESPSLGECCLARGF
ncbi:hypothetical protein PR048_004437 [Dryococelus australis]|uniref:Uncharacterized protein n=1 Tax=Dryococelus australis TaxID=614101 RepID=A0ABQ9I5F7_9NEOP|nr:hypothetical protein PR048_004437 [Dryococelus australis]